MTRYPNAYSTPSHRNHIKAVEANLNSAKLAQREVQKQQKSKSRPLYYSRNLFLPSMNPDENVEYRACLCDQVGMMLQAWASAVL